MAPVPHEARASLTERPQAVDETPSQRLHRESLRLPQAPVPGESVGIKVGLRAEPIEQQYRLKHYSRELDSDSESDVEPREFHRRKYKHTCHIIPQYWQ